MAHFTSRIGLGWWLFSCFFLLPLYFVTLDDCSLLLHLLRYGVAFFLYAIWYPGRMVAFVCPQPYTQIYKGQWYADCSKRAVITIGYMLCHAMSQEQRRAMLDNVILTMSIFFSSRLTDHPISALWNHCLIPRSSTFGPTGLTKYPSLPASWALARSLELSWPVTINTTLLLHPNSFSSARI